jgi:NADH-quinone oxidoreductase subunit J
VAETLFYVLGALALLSAVGVVRARMPLFSVLSLLGTFFCLAGIYLLMGFPFLAATQLLVYAGAIMVLFLFVIMLLNLGDEESLQRHAGLSLSGRRLFVGASSAALLGLVGLAAADMGGEFQASDAGRAGALDDLNLLAEQLFSRYMLPFEAASLLLLATMVGVIVLAKRQRERPERGPATQANRTEASETGPAKESGEAREAAGASR